MGDVDLPGALEDARARHHDAAVAHLAAIHEGGGVAGDENEDFRRVAEAVIADGDPAHHVGRNVIEEDQPQRQPAKKVEAEIPAGRYDRRHRVHFRSGHCVAAGACEPCLQHFRAPMWLVVRGSLSYYGKPQDRERRMVRCRRLAANPSASSPAVSGLRGRCARRQDAIQCGPDRHESRARP